MEHTLKRAAFESIDQKAGEAALRKVGLQKHLSVAATYDKNSSCIVAGKLLHFCRKSENYEDVREEDKNISEPALLELIRRLYALARCEWTGQRDWMRSEMRWAYFEANVRPYLHANGMLDQVRAKWEEGPTGAKNYVSNKCGKSGKWVCLEVAARGQGSKDREQAVLKALRVVMQSHKVCHCSSVLASGAASCFRYVLTMCMLLQMTYTDMYEAMTEMHQIASGKEKQMQGHNEDFRKLYMKQLVVAGLI